MASTAAAAGELVVQLQKPASSSPVGLNIVDSAGPSSTPVVKEVRGLALDSGLRVGDLLLAVNDVEVTDHAAAAAIIRAAPDCVTLRLKRPPPRLTAPSALHRAAHTADLATMASVLDQRIVSSVDASDGSGWTALHLSLIHI